MANATPIYLIGSGPMARAYGKVLKAQKRDVTVIGRGEASAKAFEDEIGIAVTRGGLSAFLAGNTVGEGAAIIALPVPNLAEAAHQLMAAGVRRILAEKPAGLNPAETAALAKDAAAKQAEIYVAYNRRFYASVRLAKHMIAEDGGATSFRFEISEYAHAIAKNKNMDPRVLANWFYANTSHVTDMAFFMGGFPASLNCMAAGTMEWHPDAARFAGYGVSDKGAMFSYHGDWESAPRWMVEIYTRRHAFMFSPLEALKTRAIDGFAITEHALPDDLDAQFKPGIYRQTTAFLDGTDGGDLLPIAEHAEHMSGTYAQMLSGSH